MKQGYRKLFEDMLDASLEPHPIFSERLMGRAGERKLTELLSQCHADSKTVAAEKRYDYWRIKMVELRKQIGREKANERLS